MADWNPTLYARFADERARPITDLLAQVPLAAPARIVDLGCGAGASTAPLVARWPQADVVGIDTSPAMLHEARRAVPEARFERADIANWTPEAPVDLIFSNAALHWVPDHARLLPRLMGFLAPGGVLALQMPDTLDEPSHAAMRAVAREAPFAARLTDAATSRTALLSWEDLWDVLAPSASRIEMWRTIHVHPLADVDAIVDMVRSTGLRPFLEPLDPAERAGFLLHYRERLARAYPPTHTGPVLFRFPRLYVVAERQQP